jgi:hypothetical protein
MGRSDNANNAQWAQWAYGKCTNAQVAFSQWQKAQQPKKALNVQIARSTVP